jgi:hypothetical protein
MVVAQRYRLGSIALEPEGQFGLSAVGINRCVLHYRTAFIYYFLTGRL